MILINQFCFAVFIRIEVSPLVAQKATLIGKLKYIENWFYVAKVIFSRINNPHSKWSPSFERIKSSLLPLSVFNWENKGQERWDLCQVRQTKREEEGAIF
jgi:hypothetical protein